MRRIDLLQEALKKENLSNYMGPWLDTFACFQTMRDSCFGMTRKATYENDIKNFCNSYAALIDDSKSKNVVLTVFYKVSVLEIQSILNFWFYQNCVNFRRKF